MTSFKVYENSSTNNHKTVTLSYYLFNLKANDKNMLMMNDHLIFLSYVNQSVDYVVS